MSTTWLQRWARRRVLAYLRSLKEGQVFVREDTETWRFGKPSTHFPQPTEIRILQPSAWTAIALGGSVGAGESYMEGHWACDDLSGLIRRILRNDQAGLGLDGGLARLGAPLRWLYHRLHRNTLGGSRRNISEHYDLDPRFFRLFLDSTLTYSSAVFEDPSMDLEEAARNKLEQICCKLQLNPTDHLLEIGGGWGGMAIYAATHFGCRVTTTTISAEQAAVIRERVAEAGLEDRVEVLERDYRQLTGQYDKLVSIEMLEAVGAEYVDGFFASCERLLAPHGRMLLQCISIDPRHYARHVKEVDFIKRHIFPGSCLLSLPVLMQSIARQTSLSAIHTEDIGPHYARTLRCWRERLLSEVDALHELGFDQRFVRKWLFYFDYCEAGFAERFIGNQQLLLVGPRARVDSCSPSWQTSYSSPQGALC